MKEEDYMTEKTKKVVYLIWELHNGVERRLKTGYFDKKLAYKKVDEWNNREKKWGTNSRYYVKEFMVIE